MYNYIESNRIYITSIGEFMREHEKSKPELPASDFILPRERGTYTAPIIKNRNNTTNEIRSHNDTGGSTFRSKSSGVAADLSETWNKGWSLSKGLNNRPDCCQIDVEEDIYSHSRRLESARSAFTPGVSLKSDTQRSNPLIWQVSSKEQERFITVHKRPSCSPGPKYNLQPPSAVKGPKGPPSQLCVSTVKDLTFGKDLRMPDDLYRSPGPVFFPPHRKGVLSQNQLGSPDFHTSRKLHGSIYYDRFNSPCTDVTYDTTKSFEFESKRIAVRGPKMHPITIPAKPAGKLRTLRNFSTGNKILSAS